MTISARSKLPRNALMPPEEPVNALMAGHSTMRDQAGRMQLQNFARRLHQLMLEKGMSQSDLAAMVWGKETDSRGYQVARNRDRISSYLKGKSAPEPDNLKRIAKELGVDVATLAPDATAAAVDRENPALRMTMIAGHSDKTHLQINQLVRLDIAAKIIALLNENEQAA